MLGLAVALVLAGAPTVSASHGHAPVAVTQRHKKIERERQALTRARVQSLLDRLFGVGRSEVAVSLELDFTYVTVGTKKRSPTPSPKPTKIPSPAHFQVLTPSKGVTYNWSRHDYVVDEELAAPLKRLSVVVRVKGLREEAIDRVREVVAATAGADREQVVVEALPEAGK